MKFQSIKRGLDQGLEKPLEGRSGTFEVNSRSFYHCDRLSDASGQDLET